jgi:hypothetical protein
MWLDDSVLPQYQPRYRTEIDLRDRISVNAKQHARYVHDLMCARLHIILKTFPLACAVQDHRDLALRSSKPPSLV